MFAVPLQTICPARRLAALLSVQHRLAALLSNQQVRRQMMLLLPHLLHLRTIRGPAQQAQQVALPHLAPPLHPHLAALLFSAAFFKAPDPRRLTVFVSPTS